MIKKFFILIIFYFTFIFDVNAYNVYNQGDILNYNGIDYYVLYDSDESSNVLTLLKAEPLTVSEVEKYGVGHINNYSMYSQHEIYDYNDTKYGRIVYYSSEQCGLVNGENIFSDCKYDYESSEIKYVVDAWAKDNLEEKDLWKDNLGYSYRLITKEEILEYMNYSLYNEYDYSYVPIEGKTPSWIYNDKYFYSTMSDINRINIYGSQIIGVYFIGDDGKLLRGSSSPYVTPMAVRPVILLRKKALESKINSNTNNNISSNGSSKQSSIIKNDTNSNSNINTSSLKVIVSDTFTKLSILFITIGIILIGTATTLIIYIKNRRKNEKDN